MCAVMQKKLFWNWDENVLKLWLSWMMLFWTVPGWERNEWRLKGGERERENEMVMLMLWRGREGGRDQKQNKSLKRKKKWQTEKGREREKKKISEEKWPQNEIKMAKKNLGRKRERNLRLEVSEKLWFSRASLSFRIVSCLNFLSCKIKVEVKGWDIWKFE